MKLIWKHFLFGDVLLVYWLEIGILGFILLLKVYVGFLYSSTGFLKIIGSFIQATILNAVLFISTILVPMYISLLVMSYYVPGGLEKQHWTELIRPAVWQAALFILLSHVVSFVVNFIGRGEFRTWASRLQNIGDRTNGLEEVFVMQKRFIAVMFVCIGAGFLLLVRNILIDYMGFAVSGVTATAIAIILFVIAKVYIDLELHIQEHKEVVIVQ